MNNLIALTKVFIKNNLYSSKKKNKKGLPPIVNVLLLGALFLFCFSIPISKMVSSAYDLYGSIGQEGVIVGLLLSMTSVLIFFFGIIYVMGTFYFSSDIEYLLPLPLKANEIVTAKFITVLIFEYYTEIIILLLPLIVYGIKSGAAPLYWVYLIIIFLLIPILPLVFASIINMIIMSFTNLGKHKDLLRVVGGVIGIGFAIGINLFFNTSQQDSLSPEKLNEMLMVGNNSLVDILSSIFPSSNVGTQALLNASTPKGFMNILLLIAFTLISILLFTVFAKALYFKGALGSSETFSKRKKLSSKEMSKATKEGSAFLTYLRKEINVLFRTPSYFINCVLTSLITPIILIIVFFTGQNNILSESESITAFLNNPNYSSIILIIVSSAVIFMASSNVISATAISREGKNLYVLKYIPLSFSSQLFAKILSGVIFGLVTPILVLVAFIYFKASTNLIIASIITMLLATLASNLFAIIIDVKHPKLDWDNEQHAVKQNFRAFLTTMIELVFAGVLAFGLIILNLDFMISFAALLVILLVLNIVLYVVIKNNAEKWFTKLS